MQLKQIGTDFYQILNVFDEETYNLIRREFAHKHKWNVLSQGDTERLEGTLSFPIELKEIEIAISDYFGERCYPNTPQLWYDRAGYINGVHKDLSPNLQANVQIYLGEGDTDMGTHCFIDSQWMSVPYIMNYGYLMFNPTKHEHGMKTPVIRERYSLYQSYRLTEEPSPIW